MMNGELGEPNGGAVQGSLRVRRSSEWAAARDRPGHPRCAWRATVWKPRARQSDMDALSKWSRKSRPGKGHGNAVAMDSAPRSSAFSMEAHSRRYGGMKSCSLVESTFIVNNAGSNAPRRFPAMGEDWRDGFRAENFHGAGEAYAAAWPHLKQIMVP